MVTMNRTDLEDKIKALNTEKDRIHKKMAALRREEKYKDDDFDPDLADEYQRLNVKLMKTKIKEAELVYLKNMI